MRRIAGGIPAFFLFLLTSCSAFSPTILPTYTPTIPSTPTSTIAWFPPTNTATLYIPPESTSIEIGLIGLGEVLFTDNFDQPDLWLTETSPSAKASMESNRLTLSVSEANGAFIMATRKQPLLGDFYATLKATLNFCQADDSYGVLFRVMSPNDYYRFDINCNGQVRLVRLRSGQLSVLQDWVSSGDAPPGSPGEVQIGVWAAGTEMRLFLNERFQLSGNDWLFPSGTFGVFVKSGANTPLMVFFSDLSVSAVSYASPTPIATETETSIPTRTPQP